ncbi:MAG: penicillin-binding protein activator [Telluria sp.]
MLINRLKGVGSLLVLAHLGGCALPCGAPGGLCAPPQPNTSILAQLPPPEPAAPGRPGAAARPNHALVAETASIGAEKSASQVRIALLLPLQSSSLGAPAAAIRDGFMAAWELDHDGVQVDLVPTSDNVQDTLAAYQRAAGAHDIVVGPLARPAVDALASSNVERATIALNHPDAGVTLPPRMLAIGLSIEDEARQAADWAAREHPAGRALVLAGSQAWQQRMAHAFELRWSELGRNSHLAELPADDSRVDGDAIDLVRTQMEVDPPELIFAALDAVQLRQVRGVLGTATACYAASPANPGRSDGGAAAELDGLRLLDLPWEVQPDHQAVMIYPRRLETSHTLDMDRLYALGIDAYRVAQELARHPDAPVSLDGVTGKLDASLGKTPGFRRTEATVIYRDGAFEATSASR